MRMFPRLKIMFHSDFTSMRVVYTLYDITSLKCRNKGDISEWREKKSHFSKYDQNNQINCILLRIGFLFLLKLNY